ncbi:MAG: molybdate ABC transporter substrate-binding protein [Gammaproteobacteria bacterium]|nr:molybdate ABC transporter substrate-binding protein [Gammaproteobacteria bacterium]
MKTRYYLLLLCVFISHSAFGETIRIAAASDLRYVMPALIEAFEKKHPQSNVQAVFGPSGRFYSQIQNGAPFHVFMSADIEYPQQLRAANYRHGEVVPYALGSIALWHAQNHPPSLADLQKARRIAIANPQTAPYGKMALAWLSQLDNGDTLTKRLVFAESAAQVAHLVRSGGAQLGISALTVLNSSELEGFGRYSAIPIDTGYMPIVQGMMLTERGIMNELAQHFYSFVRQDAEAIFQAHGFMLP